MSPLKALITFGLLTTTAGCGAAPQTVIPALAAPGPTSTSRRAEPVSWRYQSATAAIAYRDARYPLHSDKFEFKSGRFLPLDDGMGPSGDTDFFYDGTRFFVVTNEGGGVKRGISTASDSADPSTLRFRAGPLPIAPGDSFIVKTPDGYADLVVDALSTGSMRLTPDAISGSGSVSFRYRLNTD